MMRKTGAVILGVAIFLAGGAAKQAEMQAGGPLVNDGGLADLLLAMMALLAGIAVSLIHQLQVKIRDLHDHVTDAEAVANVWRDVSDAQAFTIELYRADLKRAKEARK